ncbi:MAG: hypothetical protein CMO61_14675 [Verrucomicrobiales bacterium]|jgi:hypothetical protein|nr:hypothetical protein [Verrucomicrobiales bacterium]|tara:strand:+ start:12592 stop:12999 length:408 start_codon:yes stop_codon:yes gene_type:complete
MAKGFDLEGVVKVIDEVQTFASGFSKREFVVEVEDGKYPQSIKFECVKEKTSLTDGLKIGDSVKVSFDIRGNEYNGRYYVNLNAWKVENASGAGAPVEGQGQESNDEGGPVSSPSEPPAGYDSKSGSPDDDDIPF